MAQSKTITEAADLQNAKLQNSQLDCQLSQFKPINFFKTVEFYEPYIQYDADEKMTK